MLELNNFYEEEVKNSSLNLPSLKSPYADEYPAIEYLESDYVADWLKVRQDQLLEIAKSERFGSNLSKTLGLSVSFLGFLFHAASPLAPIGFGLSAVSYAWSVFKDLNHTHQFAPLPFIRGNFLETVGSLGAADLREEYFASLNEFSELEHYLSPYEREEYLMLNSHLHTLTEYLSQVAPLKRFHAYRWLLDNWINLKGGFPTTQQLHDHVSRVSVNPVVNKEVVHKLKEMNTPTLLQPIPQPQSLPSLPTPQTQDLPQVKSQSLPTPQSQTQSNNLNNFKDLPLKERARAIIKKLTSDGFNIGGCIQGQTTVICGTQRGGKGTLLAILAILSKALNPETKITYITAGKDIYPFKVDKLIYAGSYPYAPNPDARVAQDLYTHIKDMQKAEVNSLSNEILVIDEAIALSGHLGKEESFEVARFLLTQAEKTGCLTFLVLHAQNLTAWVKDTGGLAATFKNSLTFVGCKSQTTKVNELRTISFATGEYFLADPQSFAKPLDNGELGKIPDWLKTETNPFTGMPDPVRTLLTYFPELMQYSEEEFIQDDVEIVKEVVEELPSRPSRENDFNFVLKLSEEVYNYAIRNEWTTFNLDKVRKTKAFKYEDVGLNNAEVEAILNLLTLMGKINKVGDEFTLTQK